MTESWSEEVELWLLCSDVSPVFFEINCTMEWLCAVLTELLQSDSKSIAGVGTLG